MAAKGQPKTGGRRKGTPNKLNADVQAMILAALDMAGGVEYLARQAETNPSAFLGLWARCCRCKSQVRITGQSST